MPVSYILYFSKLPPGELDMVRKLTEYAAFIIINRAIFELWTPFLRNIYQSHSNMGSPPAFVCGLYAISKISDEMSIVCMRRRISKIERWQKEPAATHKNPY